MRARKAPEAITGEAEIAAWRKATEARLAASRGAQGATFGPLRQRVADAMERAVCRIGRGADRLCREEWERQIRTGGEQELLGLLAYFDRMQHGKEAGRK